MFDFSLCRWGLLDYMLEFSALTRQKHSTCKIIPYGEGVTVPVTSIIASVSPLVAIRNRNSSLLSAEV